MKAIVVLLYTVPFKNTSQTLSSNGRSIILQDYGLLILVFQTFIFSFNVIHFIM